MKDLIVLRMEVFNDNQEYIEIGTIEWSSW